jgi:hypothetical protein
MPYRFAAFPFGIAPTTCEIRSERDGVYVRFGRWQVETSLDNIADVEITGPYTFVRTAGPAHLSLTGLTFASNGDRGVCMRFNVPVAGIEPMGVLRHPSLTVTVADCDGLATALGRTT